STPRFRKSGAIVTSSATGTSISSIRASVVSSKSFDSSDGLVNERAALCRPFCCLLIKTFDLDGSCERRQVCGLFRCRDAELAPIRTRRELCHPPEQAPEKSRVLIANLPTVLVDGRACPLQPTFCFFHP